MNVQAVRVPEDQYALVVRFAYLILAHVEPELLRRLIARLYTPEDTFLLHIDAKKDLAPFVNALGELTREPNLHFVPRTKVYWGDVGMLQAALNGVEYAVQTGVDYDYMVLLTGRDYPIKPLATIRERLERDSGTVFMEHHRLPRADWPAKRGGLTPENHGLERLEHWHFRFLGRLWRLPNAYLPFIPTRRVPGTAVPYQGSAFWWMPRECVEYLQRFIEDNPAFVRFFRRAYAPDESFVQTVLLNSRYRNSVVSDHLRYSEWRPEYWPHVTILGAADFPKLERSDRLFGSKFDTRLDADILDLIDRRLLDRVPPDRP